MYYELQSASTCFSIKWVKVSLLSQWHTGNLEATKWHWYLSWERVSLHFDKTHSKFGVMRCFGCYLLDLILGYLLSKEWKMIIVFFFKLLEVLPRDIDQVESILLIWICTFQAIGAEYGEGFETFRSDGPLKVDVVSKILCPLMHIHTLSTYASSQLHIQIDKLDFTQQRLSQLLGIGFMNPAFPFCCMNSLVWVNMNK